MFNIYNCLGTIAVGTIFEAILYLGWFAPEAITPQTIHDNSNFNWIGCWFYFILLGIFSPVLFCIKTLNWLFRMGRRD